MMKIRLLVVFCLVGFGPSGGGARECTRLQISGGEGSEFGLDLLSEGSGQPVDGCEEGCGEDPEEGCGEDPEEGCGEDPEEELICWGIPVSKSACDPGWEEFDSFCYKPQMIPKIWTEALADCKEQDGNLASVSKVSVSLFLVELGVVKAKQEAGVKWWLGGTDAEKEDTWAWEDGQMWDYVNWDEDEPNNGGWFGSENCLTVNLENEAMWTDETCSIQLPYICKKQITGAPQENYKVLRRISGESWILPAGWKFLSYFDPMMGEILPKLIKTPEDQQMMTDGNLVLLTRARKNEVIEQWNYKEVGSPEEEIEVPEGWEYVQIDDSNFEDYKDQIGYMMNNNIAMKLHNKLIKFIRKVNQGVQEPMEKEELSVIQDLKPDWDIHVVGNQVLKGWKIVDMNETNFEDHQLEVRHLLNSSICSSLENGTIQLVRREEPDYEPESDSEPEPESEPELPKHEEKISEGFSWGFPNVFGESESEQEPETEPEPEEDNPSSDSESDLMPTGELSCSNTQYGCCPDGINPQHGEGGLGCCTGSMFGCCPDSLQPAKGPYFEGCECENYQFGCCPDKITPAKGLHNYGCGCQYTPFRCCPDQISIASGHNYEGCPCETFMFGCCSDGVTPASGPNMEGCDNCGEYGCCDDFITPANGPDKLGCGCESSYYGCCPDGSTAKGPDFRGCLTVPGENCHHPSEGGSHCGEYTHKWFYDMDYGGCNRFWYGGCDPGRNHYDTEETCKNDCISPRGSAVCFLKKVVGPCEGEYHEWYYDISVRACRPFTYSGCLGNGNRFETKDDCQSMCVPEEDVPVCEKPKAEGSCNGDHSRWFYNKKSGDCEEFSYSGCKGNNNRFTSYHQCSATCLHTAKKWKTDKICQLHMEPGHCDGRNDTVARWGYSQYVRRCVPFYYLGCSGNENNFALQSDCESVCPTTFSPIISLPSGDEMLFERGYPTEQIPVSIKANPPANVIWKHNGRDISIYDSQWRMLDDFSLEINNVADHIAGNYTVVADNGIGDPTFKTIEVIVFPVFPKVHIDIDKTIYKPKSNIIMECKVKGHPPPSIHWYKRTHRGDQVQLENDGIKIYIDTIQESTLDITSRLTLRTVDTEDTAKYTCTAVTNFAAPVSKTKSISVQFEPGELCMDRPSYTNCPLVVKHNFCGNKYYGKFCCRSCTDAGHMPGGGR